MPTSEIAECPHCVGRHWFESNGTCSNCGMIAEAVGGASEPVRWTLVEDDDSHRYLIPVALKAEFEEAVRVSISYWDDMPDSPGQPPADPGSYAWVHRIEGGDLTFAAPEYDGKAIE